MKRVTIDGESYALPFADIVRPHTPAEEAALDASIREIGVTTRIIWYFSPTHGRAIIDGAKRVTIAIKYDKDIPLDPPRKVDDEAARRIAVATFARRHLSDEDLRTLRGERIVRIAVARFGDGKSLRAIARDEQVSVEQVRQDLAVAGVKGLTPAPTAGGATSSPPTVTGLDGKTYPASRPVKRRPKSVAAKAHHVSGKLAAAVRAVLRGTQRVRLVALAEAAGVPIDGTEWPALEQVRAVLRDLSKPAVSV